MNENEKENMKVKEKEKEKENKQEKEKEKGWPAHHLLQVGGQLVEPVDGAYVDPAGVLVHHQLVELRPLLLGGGARVRELPHYVQTRPWGGALGLGLFMGLLEVMTGD